MSEMIEHAKETLEIVDLLQAMVPDCKCEALHVLTHTEESAGPCSVLAVARSRHCARDWFLVCDEYAEYYKWVMGPQWDHPWRCRDCHGACWELMPV